MAISLQAHKIDIGSTEYPTKHNAMIDAVENAVNSVDEWDNASLLEQTAAEVLQHNMAAQGARFGAITAMRKAKIAEANVAAVVDEARTLGYWFGIV